MIGLRPLVLAAFLGARAAAPPPLTGQATNPPYLNEFPTVERVKQAMEVSDPRETAIRQMGALWQLQQVIKALAGPREFRGLTPDEGKLVGAYAQAQNRIAQAIDSAFPGPYGKWRRVSANTPYAYMRSDPRFGVEGIETFTLLPDAVQDQFRQITGAEQPRFAARARADTEAMMRARAQEAQAQQEQARGSATQGGDSRRMRRCVESGRNEMQCMTEGVGKSFTGLLGAVVPGLKRAPVQGIRLSGVYPGEGHFSLTFGNESVIVGCSDLLAESRDYSTAVTEEGLRIRITSLPGPIVLMMRADGRLAGNGPTDIAGQIITGYQQGVRTWSDGRTEPISRPIYANVTRRCNVGILTASGPSPAAGSMTTAVATALSLAFGSPDRDAGKPVPVGMRVSGEYGSQTALDLEFHPEGVVVGCAEATALRPYAVQVQGGRVMIGVQNGPNPFTVSFGADGSLNGTGAVRVEGRMATGTAPNGDIAYAPRSATCSLGTLAPTAPEPSRAEAGPGAARTTTSPPAGTAGSNPTGILGPAAAAIAMPTPGAGVVFQLENGLPAPAGSPNPLAGRGFLVLDVPLDRIITPAGGAGPAALSAAKALEQACSTPGVSANCQALVNAMNSHEVAVLRADQGGTAESPELPAGRSYFLFGAAVSGGRKYTWHLELPARAGWTKVTLGPSNALPDR